MRKIVVEHGSCLLDINGDTLRGTMINKFGEVRDDFALVKRGKVRQQRLINPWQPAPWKPSKYAGDDAFSAEPPEDFLTAIPKYSTWLYMPGNVIAGLPCTDLA